MRKHEKNKNQLGQASAEFLLSISVVFGVFILFLFISVTLTAVEVSQYIAFSVARTQAGANSSPSRQQEVATQKMVSFQNNRAFRFLFKSGWFSFGEGVFRQGGGGPTFREELAGSREDPFRKVFTGVMLPFQAKILGVAIPFLHQSSEEGVGFSSKVYGIIIRESSQAECQAYWSKENRGTALGELPSGSRYQRAKYYSMEDSGC